MDGSSALVNTGLLTEAVIIEAHECLSGAAPLTPSGLYALNSVVEATILHDRVLLGLFGIAGGQHASVKQLEEGLGSDIAQVPDVLQFEDRFSVDDYAQLLYWVGGPGRLVNASADAELGNLGVIADYFRVSDTPPLLTEGSFESAFGVRSVSGHYGTVVDSVRFQAFNQQIKSAGGTPISPNDIVSIQDLAWQAAAARSIGATLAVELYPSLMERTFYFDLLRKPRGPLQLVHELKRELSLADLWLDEIEIPPFVGMALRDVRGDASKFWQVVRDLRSKHEAFRASVANFRTAWSSAKTLKEQRDLLLSHQRAWNALLQKEDLRRTKRLTYVLGRAATTLGKSLMDEAIELDRFDQALHQVGGLVKLWDDARSIPTTTESRELLERLFQEVAPPTHWKRVRALTEAVENIKGRAR